jgi:hypothetical protein
MGREITCACGAVYERTEVKFTVRDNDSANCQVCGEELESWNGSRVPQFRLIKRPETRAD